MTMLRSVGWILLVLLTAPAAAQEPNDFSRLVESIAPGDNIRVTLSNGRLTPGRVVDITPSRISVRVEDQRLDLRRSDVLDVRYRVADPTGDGFRRGALVGAGAFALAVFKVCSEGDCAPNYTAFGMVGGIYALAGGLIGLAMDSMTQTEVHWTAPARHAWSVAPMLTPNRQGVAVALSF